ncbi:kinase-like protein, partial [Meredithblackwellia eburnea MCA 4105]
QLGECIGRGQFGAVYRALNLNSGRVVAVKRIQLEGKTEEEIIQLSNEVSLLKALAHPGVVKYEGLVRTEHYINIILEYVENGSLQKTLKHFGELPEGLVASYVVKILEGLEYLHSRQVVHCDLKAANILSTKTGNIKIGDFGVSLNLNAVKNNRTAVGNTLNDPAAIIPEVDVAGTPNWMAPEVIELRGASTASDIWSLACTIVELISGKPPYAELNAMAAMFRIVEDDRPPIPARCSPELHDFLTQCFAKDPKERPSARSLFEHEWLNIHWEVHKELRPQDSIPFLRRISSEMRRPELNIVLNPVPEGSLSKPALFSSQPQQASAQDLAFFSSSPTSTTKNDQTSPLFGEITNYMRPTPAAELFRRASMNASRVCFHKTFSSLQCVKA